MLSLRGAPIHRGDEAISVDLAGNEIATHLSGARNDREGRARNDNPYYVIARLTQSDEAISWRGMGKLDTLVKYE